MMLAVRQSTSKSRRHVGKDFHQLEWDEAVEEDCRQIVRLADAEGSANARRTDQIELSAALCTFLI